ncbi:MAG: oligosaccharide flippase family protein, partial [Nitrospirales bacterium]|nr:oligosaccharide flippase family protein [Nitrospirales bacterium]
MKNEPLAASIARYTSSSIYQRVCGIINTFIKPRLLSPELYGIWNILALVATLATYLHLGSRNALFYRIPYAKGRGNHEKIAAIEASAFYGSLSVTLIAVAGVLLYALFREQTDAVRVGVFVIAGLILLNWYFDFYFVYLTAHQDFMLPIRMNYLKATLAVVLNAVLIYFFGIYGLYLAALLTVLFGVAVFRKVRPLEFRSEFHAGTFRELVAGGMPVMLYNITNELVSTSDKIIVAYFLGSEQLGFYSITGLVFNFLMQIPGDARDVIEPDLMKGAGHRAPEANLSEYFFKPLA